MQRILVAGVAGVAGVAAVAILATACISFSRSSNLVLDEPCSGHLCRVQLYNHTAENLSIRYADSTGRRELIGLAPAAKAKTISVQHVHSAGIRIFAIDPKGQIYAADYTFPRSGPMYVNFPDDFTVVADTLMPVRNGSK